MNVPNCKGKVLVAMSGGVDSCVTAALLAQQGHDIVGITMRVTNEHEYGGVFQPCCSIEMAKDARQVCEKFGYPHYTVNLIQQFEDSVIDDFTSEYMQGRTPNPCVRCNQRLKFGTLYKTALELEADHIATGHYVRMARVGDRSAVQRAKYRQKDQSYVMAGLSQKQLAMGLFPLGDYTKEEVRRIARDLGLHAADTPESQDICFIPDNDYKGFLHRRVGQMAPGPIYNTQGDLLGEHIGLLAYTIGQRKGLGIPGKRPYFVVRIDAANNALVVGHEEETYCTGFTADSLVWGGYAERCEPFNARVQIRYHHEPAGCTVHPEGRALRIEFDDPQRSVTPGPGGAFYDSEDRVLAAALINDFVSAPALTTVDAARI